MLLYVMRHGEAVSESQDPERPLSSAGEADVRAVGMVIGERITLFPGHIFHSPKKRAAQTAAILSQSIPHAPGPEMSDGLAPMDDPALWARRLSALDRDVLLVGHLPHVSRLVSHLVLNESGREIVEFSPGTVVCLSGTDSWRIKWALSPEILKKQPAI